MSERPRVKNLIEGGGTWNRIQLAFWTGLDDRTIRNEIRRLRREGVPIMALPDGGYKLAETDEEKKELLDMYRKRALDELTTYSHLMKSMQVAGQIAVDDFIRNMEGTKRED